MPKKKKRQNKSYARKLSMYDYDKNGQRRQMTNLSYEKRNSEQIAALA